MIDKKEKIFLIILTIFFLTSLGSSIILFSKTKLKKSPSIFNKITKNGTFIIESPSEVPVNSPFNVRFIVDSKGKNTNAVALYVKFDPQKLSVLNIDTSNSFCQFYPENKFDNTQGTISLQCGAPSPGFKGKDTLISISFMSQNIGETYLDLSEKSKILIDDGKGTNIFSDFIKQKILILNTI